MEIPAEDLLATIQNLIALGPPEYNGQVRVVPIVRKAPRVPSCEDGPRAVSITETNLQARSIRVIEGSYSHLEWFVTI